MISLFEFEKNGTWGGVHVLFWCSDVDVQWWGEMRTSPVLHEGAGPLGDAVRAIFEVLSFHLYLVFEPLFEHFLVLAQQQVLRKQLNRPLQYFGRQSLE